MKLNSQDLQSKRLSQPAAFKRCHFLPRRFQDDFELDSKVLGSGYSGDVRLGRSRYTGAPVAVKSFSAEAAAEHQVEAALDEAQIYLALDHPHIVRLHNVYMAETEIHLVMECMNGGEFFDRIRTEAPFTERSAGNFLCQMLLALAYLHQHHIAHCDVKLENFLLEDRDGDSVKLCDFGFSQLCPPNSALYKPVGTPKYMAPGVFQGCYTQTCDLWSLGVVAYIMLTNRMPFVGEDHEVQEAVMLGSWDDSQQLWAPHSPAALDFVRGLLHLDPTNRLTAHQALTHDWLKAQANPDAAMDAEVLRALRSFSSSTSLQRASFTALAWAPGSMDQRKLRSIFLALNRSNTGLLSLAELEAALKTNDDCSSKAEQEAAAIVKALDMACIGAVAYSDFLACMAAQVPLQQEQACEVFAAFDRSQTGCITRRSLEELAEGLSPNHVVSQCLVDMSPETSISRVEFLSLLGQDVIPSSHDATLPMLLGRVGSEQTSAKDGAPAKTADISERPAVPEYPTLLGSVRDAGGKMATKTMGKL